LHKRKNKTPPTIRKERRRFSEEVWPQGREGTAGFTASKRKGPAIGGCVRTEGKLKTRKKDRRDSLGKTLSPETTDEGKEKGEGGYSKT